MYYPNLIVIGAMKAGTSSLHEYLSLHPNIYASKTKELDYFLWNYGKGKDWYRSNFPVNSKYRLESSPNYAKFFKDWEYAAIKMNKDLPGCKLIYIIRDPVERTLSQCRHHQLDPNREIPKLIEFEPENEILTNSQYHRHISEFLKYFKKEQLLVIKNEDLKYDKENLLNKITHFLNIDPINIKDSHVIESNASANFKHPGKIILFLNKISTYQKIKNKIKKQNTLKQIHNKLFYKRHKTFTASPEIKEKLRDYFKNDIIKLEKLTSISFEEWKK